jgi:hypothetical protein
MAVGSGAKTTASPSAMSFWPISATLAEARATVHVVAVIGVQASSAQ